MPLRISRSPTVAWRFEIWSRDIVRRLWLWIHRGDAETRRKTRRKTWEKFGGRHAPGSNAEGAEILRRWPGGESGSSDTSFEENSQEFLGFHGEFHGELFED